MKTYEIAYRLGGQLQASFLRSMEGASGGLQKVYDQSTKLDKRLRNNGAAFDDLKSKMAKTVAGLGVGAFALGSFKKAIDFEQQISSIQAVSGIAKDAMGEIEQLALDMGAKTKYSALEAAQGIEELVKAGLSTEKIKGGGIEAALNLAAAGGLQLADAAEIMSTAMNAFRSDGMEAAHAADMLAGTANASATNVMELKMALAQASAVASGVGLSFYDTNAALGLFANNGLKGSDAGTSLKTMLMRLTPVTADAIGEFERLGLMTFDTTKALQFLESQGVKPASTATKDVADAFMTYSAKAVNAKVGTDKANKSFREMAFNAGAMSSVFYDSAGNMQNLEVISGELQNALKGLTSAQRQVALNKMFGTDAVRAANILFKEGAQGVKDFYAEASRVTALEVATTRLDNAKGSVELFRSAVETLQITAMKTLSPSLKKVADLGTEIASKHGKAVMVLGGMALAAYPIVKVTRGVIALTRAIGGFGVAMRLLSGPVGWGITALGAVAGGIALVSAESRRAKEHLMNLGKSLEKSVNNYKATEAHTKKTQELIAEYDRLKRKIDDSRTPAQELVNARAKLKKVEQQLIDMNPDILRAEDLKTGKFREQLGLLDEQNKVKLDMARRDMEAKHTETVASLPQLRADYNKETKKQKEHQDAYESARKAGMELAKYNNQMIELQNKYAKGSIDYTEFNKFKDALIEKVNKETGRNFNQALDLQEAMDFEMNKFESEYEKYKESTETVNKLTESAKSAFDNLKGLIEIDLGVSLEEAAKKYNELSADQKKQVEEGIRSLNEYKRTLNGIPIEKTVILNTLFREIGQIPPDLQPASSRNVPTISQQPSGLKVQAYEDGGIGTKPHMGVVAEKGPEAFIPLSPNKRGRALSLYDKVGKALGVRDYSSGGLRAKLESKSVVAPTASAGNVTIGDFVVNVQGNADDATLAQIRRELEQHKRNILTAVQEATRQKGRVSLA